METGIRELKENLSRHIRHSGIGQFEQLVASGVITPPLEAGDTLEDCPEIRLPPGTAAGLIDSDRVEA